MEHNEMIEHDKQGWHLDKRISVAHILTTVAMTAALAAWMWALSERVTLNEQRIQTHQQVVAVEIENIQSNDKQIMLNLERHYQEILRRLERIEDGVDRHIESQKQHEPE